MNTKTRGSWEVELNATCTTGSRVVLWLKLSAAMEAWGSCCSLRGLWSSQSATCALHHRVGRSSPHVSSCAACPRDHDSSTTMIPADYQPLLLRTARGITTISTCCSIRLLYAPMLPRRRNDTHQRGS